MLQRCCPSHLAHPPLPPACHLPVEQDRLENNDVRYRFVIDIQGSLVA